MSVQRISAPKAPTKAPKGTRKRTSSPSTPKAPARPPAQKPRFVFTDFALI